MKRWIELSFLKLTVFLTLLSVPERLNAAVHVTVGGAQDKYALIGRVVTPDGVKQGKVVVNGDTISCVGRCATPAGATIIQTPNAYILPGLIDAHNHVPWNVFPKWKPPQLYTSRYQWQQSPSFLNISSTFNSLKMNPYLYCHMVGYGEVKALISGITTIQETPSADLCGMWLVRNAENANELNLPARYIVPTVQKIDNYMGLIDWNQTKAFVIHLGEGTDSLSLAEFGTLKTKGLLHANTTIIHGTAFGMTEFSEMAAVGAKLVWSPQSELTLYGRSTDIKAARQAGVKLALGVDWNLTGSDSIFDEARVARAVNSEEFDEAIPESEWLSLVTANAADVLALGSHVGRITQGLKADIVVLRRRDDEPNRSFLKSDLEDVEWVMIGGQSLYGNEVSIQQLRPDQCEPITVHRSPKRICMPPIQTLAGLQQVLLNAYPDLAPLAP